MWDTPAWASQARMVHMIDTAKIHQQGLFSVARSAHTGGSVQLLGSQLHGAHGRRLLALLASISRQCFSRFIQASSALSCQLSGYRPSQLWLPHTSSLGLGWAPASCGASTGVTRLLATPVTLAVQPCALGRALGDLAPAPHAGLETLLILAYILS